MAAWWSKRRKSSGTTIAEAKGKSGKSPSAGARQPSRPVMTWALDLGNTRLKLGLVLDGVLDEVHLWERTQQGQALAFVLEHPCAGYILMSGLPSDEERWRPALEAVAPVYIYRAGDPLPIELAYRTPQTLGVDRLAAVIAARMSWPDRNCLIVSAGTCLTVEHLSASGVYQGGSISPGLGMRLRAMHDYTGGLPQVELVLPKGDGIGTDTTSALQQGAIRGAAFEVLGWWQADLLKLRSHLSDVEATAPGHEADVQLVLCGGDAPLLRPLLPGATAVRPHLVLEGLAQLHAYALSA